MEPEAPRFSKLLPILLGIMGMFFAVLLYFEGYIFRGGSLSDMGGNIARSLIAGGSVGAVLGACIEGISLMLRRRRMARKNEHTN